MCVICSTQQLDPATLDAFGARVLDIMSSSATSLMISLGYRSGLFETLKKCSRPSSSAEIAEAAGLNERYVREWLGAMTAARIVEVDPTASSTTCRPSTRPC
jgi:hypothetical protein